MIALRHLAAPANWCRQITGWRTGPPSPQACRRSYPQAAVAILIQRCHYGAETSVIAITCGAFAANRAEGSCRSRETTRPHVSGAILHKRENSAAGKRPDIQSVDRSSNSPARRECQSRRFRRVPQGGLPPKCLGVAAQAAEATAPPERRRSELHPTACRARDNRQTSGRLR
jgi:hypothetical protein